MNMYRFLFGRPMAHESIEPELEEREREVAELERRLARILHLLRERDLYRRQERHDAN